MQKRGRRKYLQYESGNYLPDTKVEQNDLAFHCARVHDPHREVGDQGGPWNDLRRKQQRK